MFTLLVEDAALCEVAGITNEYEQDRNNLGKNFFWSGIEFLFIFKISRFQERHIDYITDKLDSIDFHIM